MEEEKKNESKMLQVDRDQIAKAKWQFIMTHFYGWYLYFILFYFKFERHPVLVEIQTSTQVDRKNEQYNKLRANWHQKTSCITQQKVREKICGLLLQFLKLK